jgi:glycosyltransferase involved in cell wall biosynthesis
VGGEEMMDVTVALDARYTVAADGSVWAQAGMARPFWERYLDVFERVTIVARGAQVLEPPQGWLRVDGSGVVYHHVSDFHGPSGFLRRYPAIRADIDAAVPAHGAVILRVGSLIANCLERQLSRRRHPYALELVGDPYEVFAPGVVSHPLRPFFRWYFSRRLRQQCRRAIGVAYVTKRALQKRYPAGFMGVSVSDVELPDEAMIDGAPTTDCASVELHSTGFRPSGHRVYRSPAQRLVTVGSLAQMYKGTDVLIEAVAHCVRWGLDLTAVIVGEGRYRSELMAQANRVGLDSRIRFVGQVTAGEAVRRILDEADLFVLPSRTEGMPRALIEAMARALPCIGSAVGGIAELLDESELVAPGDAVALAAKIREVVSDVARLTTLSRRNLERAQEYRNVVLRLRRRRYYTHVRDITQKWEASTALRS